MKTRRRALDLSALSQASVSKINLLECNTNHGIRKRRAGTCIKKRKASNAFMIMQPLLNNYDTGTKPQAMQSPIVSYSQHIYSIIPDELSDYHYVPDSAQSAVHFDDQSLDEQAVDKEVLQNNISRISNFISSHVDSDDECGKMRNSVLSDIADLNYQRLYTLEDDTLNLVGTYNEQIPSLHDFITNSPQTAPLSDKNSGLMEQIEDIAAIPAHYKRYLRQFSFNSMYEGRKICIADMYCSQDTSDIFENCQTIFNFQISEPVQYYSYVLQTDIYCRNAIKPALRGIKAKIYQIRTVINAYQLSIASMPIFSSESGSFLRIVKETKTTLHPNRLVLADLANTVANLAEQLSTKTLAFSTPGHESILQSAKPAQKYWEKATSLVSFYDLKHFVSTNADIAPLLFPDGKDHVFWETNGELHDYLYDLLHSKTVKLMERAWCIHLPEPIDSALLLLNIVRINVTAVNAQRFYFNCPMCQDIFVSTLSQVKRLDARRCPLLRNLMIDGPSDPDGILVERVVRKIREHSLLTVVVSE